MRRRSTCMATFVGLLPMFALVPSVGRGADAVTDWNQQFLATIRETPLNPIVTSRA